MNVINFVHGLVGAIMLAIMGAQVVPTPPAPVFAQAPSATPVARKQVQEAEKAAVQYIQSPEAKQALESRPVPQEVIKNNETAMSPAQPPAPAPHAKIVTPPGETANPTPSVAGAAAPESQARIEIVSPYPTKGLGREYKMAPAGVNTWDEATGNDNILVFGAVLYAADGSVDRTSTMTVTATDESQNKTIDGTGTFWGQSYVNGELRPDYYYPFNYLFRTAGQHTITFSANGVSQSVTVTAN